MQWHASYHAHAAKAQYELLLGTFIAWVKALLGILISISIKYEWDLHACMMWCNIWHSHSVTYYTNINGSMIYTYMQCIAIVASYCMRLMPEEVDL